MTPTPTKPTILLIPGSWHTTACYDRMRTLLHSAGYETQALQLPSVGADPPHADFAGDVAGIAAAATRLIDAGKELVVLAHSYAGMPAGEALAGLGTAERRARGLDGGVRRLVYVMALAVPEGFSCISAATPAYPEWMDVDAEKGIVTVSPANAKRVFYNDMPAHEADAWAARLTTESEGVYRSTTTRAAWRTVPSTFVNATLDQTSFTPEVVQYMLSSARAAVPSAFDVVETAEGAGHCVMITRPEWMVGVVRRAAGEAV